LALNEAPDTARAKLLERVAKGRALAAMQGHSGERLDAFDLAFQKWNDYNETLLGALFTNDTEGTNY
jgi:hypothetical protein